MNLKLINVLKIFGYLVLIIIIATVISMAASYSSLELVNRQGKEVTPENYDQIKGNIKNNDIVSIEGTVDFLYVVNDSSNSGYHFVGLKEYNNAFIIKIKSEKLNFDKQKFSGKAVLLSDDSFSKALIRSINSSIDFNNEDNKKLQDLNEMVKNKIIDASKGEFNNSSILILDGEVVNKDQIYTNVIIASILIFIFLLMLFRRKIFMIKKKDEMKELN